MTVGFSGANVITPQLNAVRSGGTTFTVVAGTFVKLHIGDPGAAGANNAAAGSTTRVAVTQAASAAGSALTMNGTPPAWTNAATNEVLTHISIWSASSAGNFLYSAQLTTPQAWVNGNVYTLSSLTYSIGPLAA